MKNLLCLLALVGLLGCGARERPVATIDPDLSADRAALEDFAKEYLRALREERWEDAVAFHEPGTFEMMGAMDPAGVMELIGTSGEIPEAPPILSIEIEGDRAVVEYDMEPRPFIRPPYYLEKTDGTRVWAEPTTAEFVKVNGVWKFSKEGFYRHKAPR